MKLLFLSNIQVSQEEEARQEAEESLRQKTEDYDLLYSEHEDEVMAVLQQKQQLQLVLEDLQGRYQNLIAVHEEQVSPLKKYSSLNT